MRDVTSQSPNHAKVESSPEPVQRPLDPRAGYLAGVPAPELHPWQTGREFPPTVRMAWARDVYVETSPERLTLLILTAYSDRWAVCWPSLSAIAERGCCSRSTVTRALNTLERKGYLLRDRPKDRPPCPKVDRPPWWNSTVYGLMEDCR